MCQYVPCPENDLEISWDKRDYLRIYDEKSILVIGYRVELTATEHGIVKLLMESEDGMSAEDIIKACFKNKDSTKAGVAVHVCNINKKVARVTGRRFIEGDRRKGYKIVENI